MNEQDYGYYDFPEQWGEFYYTGKDEDYDLYGVAYPVELEPQPPFYPLNTFALRERDCYNRPWCTNKVKGSGWFFRFPHEWELVCKECEKIKRVMTPNYFCEKKVSDVIFALTDRIGHDILKLLENAAERN